MEKEQIAVLRKLSANGTPMPWNVARDSYGMFDCLWGPGDTEIIRGGSDQRSSEAQGRDMHLVAAIRNALTRLLDEREALLAALKARGACTSNACLKAYLSSCAVVAKAEEP